MCQEYSLQQLVSEPTRGEYLLDLVLTDLPCSVKVMPMVADHKCLFLKIPVEVSPPQVVHRYGWIFKQARWEALRRDLASTSWDFISNLDLDVATERFTLSILAAARVHIPCRSFCDYKGKHPWLNDRCRNAIATKHAHEGTPHFTFQRDRCSQILTEEYFAYVARIRQDIKRLDRGSKKWWKLNAMLLNRKGKQSSVSALRADDGTWVLDSVDKANLFAITWDMKQTLPPASNEPLHLPPASSQHLDHVALRARSALKFLKALDVSITTGPDMLPARVLHEVASVIHVPLIRLCRRILQEGHWPKLWRLHNLVPIYKRKSIYDPNNYRGVHITSILSKVVERIIGAPMLSFFTRQECYGLHQWAYRPHRSSKDLVTLLICSWLASIYGGRCIGAYLSDIAGAFDRVFKPFLLSKLQAHGMQGCYLRFISSFLDRRFGEVCVEGKKSAQFSLEDQVFQGTVLGPPLWNNFFADVVTSMLTPKSGKVFADDLNVFNDFDHQVPDHRIMHKLHEFRDEVHAWGQRNRVEFDAGKEHFVIVHPTRGVGEDFKLLGLVFDHKLRMDSGVDAILKTARPKCRMLMHSRPYYSNNDMIMQFKTHILGIVESNIGGIYHATQTVLAPLDRLATSFVHALNIEVDVAFLQFNLAPLALRRDIAMLGFLHKCNLPHAHPHIRELFPPMGRATRSTHSRAMWNILNFETGPTFHSEVLSRSIFHLTHVYNALPQHIANINDISQFQHALTHLARHKCIQHHANWQTFLSPRHFTGTLLI